jgi:hypothetical protein
MKTTLLLFFILLSGFADAAPFTMTCRGGGQMVLWLKPDILHIPRTGGEDILEPRTKGNLIFKKSEHGAQGRKLLPGTCAWSHRGLNNKENSPVNISFSGVYEAVLGKNGDAVVSYFSPNTVKPDRKIEHIRNAIKNGQYFSMIVKFEKGKLIATKLNF